MILRVFTVDIDQPPEQIAAVLAEMMIAFFEERFSDQAGGALALISERLAQPAVDRAAVRTAARPVLRLVERDDGGDDPDAA
jgi:hypothetical protein